MEDERAFQRYFEVLQRWGTPHDLEMVLRRFTPEELHAILKALGSPDEIESLIKLIKSRAEDWRWANTSRQKFTTAAKLLLVVGAVVALLRPFWQRISEWWAG